MASMVPYRSVFGIRPTSLFDALDDMMDFVPSSSTRASCRCPRRCAAAGDGMGNERPFAHVVAMWVLRVPGGKLFNTASHQGFLFRRQTLSSDRRLYR